MKPLLVLVMSFVLLLVGTGLVYHTDLLFAGNASMSLMLLFTAFGHFRFKEAMANMIPDFIPSRELMVTITGYVEIAAAIGLFIVGIRTLTSILLIIFFLCILPANIHAALKSVDYQQKGKSGNGPTYLWFRIPMQIFLIAWVWYFGIRLM
jgi:uncharacterized membrane protein